MPFFIQDSISRAHGSRSEKFTICSFCKPRKDGSSVRKSCKRLTASGERDCYAKLSKPPKARSRKLPTTRRLQKSLPSPLIPLPLSTISTTVYLLQFEAYPYNTTPATILGVFSSLDTVTAGAISHGAYAFSREGLHDGTEYLSPTGRIRILTEEVQQAASKPIPQRQANYIPHPDARVEAEREAETRTLYVASHQVKSKTSCLGLFTEKIKAWTVCVKNQAASVSRESLLEEERWSDEKGLPYIRARIVGSGSHLWFVSAFEVDKVVR